MIVRVFKRKRDIALWVHEHFRPITRESADLVADAVACRCDGGWMIDASVAVLEATVCVVQGLPVVEVCRVDRDGEMVRVDTLEVAGVEVELPGL